MDIIDVDSIRRDLENQYGPASMYDEAARAALITIQSASDSQIIDIAYSHGIDPYDYEIKNKTR